ncbi:carboxymuconolactone decarboxylase family protein [Corticibacter populi]|uniref:Carboxymuconolactone decarboxylase family protein n=1 Tax=Corticibacter populi TaxID=1550736 RepID=A0A3M6R024_9BURK|nr:carboxymuconolactone decarboxylase family protein [Corticibacter populi]RMX08616.1 carboxymuconolactone decarboxylase family protein [Corticibacter populi]RZS35945.1 AhpD family alkylhydroperoxidase [Corticibacter populi]
MTMQYKQLTQTISTHLAHLHKTQAGVMKGFGDMGKTAMAGGALDPKTKELIALAVGVAARCDGCIGFHTKALARLGATTEEVHEALGVAIYMGGGPVAMYAANAVAAFTEFAAPVQA